MIHLHFTDNLLTFPKKSIFPDTLLTLFSLFAYLLTFTDFTDITDRRGHPECDTSGTHRL